MTHGDACQVQIVQATDRAAPHEGQQGTSGTYPERK
ncbi:conserved hypothetical protein [Nitrosococcus watsonii C-113]|uniref:Uncharacterized protein n=1 Tax=Nitrosococcus watsoni (strain C-113) TaxID=105559 RepID=D8KAJ4_NITWC|nr:conserved hypothetical protein [Nitrosococcus watsonii C-113]